MCCPISVLMKSASVKGMIPIVAGQVSRLSPTLNGDTPYVMLLLRRQWIWACRAIQIIMAALKRGCRMFSARPWAGAVLVPLEPF